MKEWALAAILVFLSPEMEQVRQYSETREGLIPGSEVVEHFAHWSGPEGELYAFLWEPYPDRDGGPMASAESWPVSVLDTEGQVSRTSMFQGSEREVLVLHAKLSKPDSNLMIYSPDMSRENFTKMAQNLRYRYAER